MDITVTTPLEMNVGQQKYVVAYTLKQGVEKQPDILNAQKTSTNNIDSVQKMGSPAAIRPDALFSTSSLTASSKQTKANNSFSDFQQKSTPSSHQSTLKRNENSNKSYMPLNQTITSNYNTQPPPYCSTMMMNDYEPPLNYTYSSSTSGTSNLPNTTNNNSFHKMSPEYNNLNNMFNNANATAAAAAASNNHNLNNELIANQDGFIEYERTTLDHRLGNSISCENADTLNQSNSGLNGGSGSEQQRYSGSDYANDTMDYKNLANQIANTISNINSTLNRSRNRNHIITDALPGPESCV